MLLHTRENAGAHPGPLSMTLRKPPLLLRPTSQRKVLGSYVCSIEKPGLSGGSAVQRATRSTNQVTAWKGNTTVALLSLVVVVFLSLTLR